MLFLLFFFFFNDTATTEIYTLSLHDALPISCRGPRARRRPRPKHPRWRRHCPGSGTFPRSRAEPRGCSRCCARRPFLSTLVRSLPCSCVQPCRCPLCPHSDRKSTRLNSSHSQISYAVFCLKKKK